MPIFQYWHDHCYNVYNNLIGSEAYTKEGIYAWYCQKSMIEEVIGPNGTLTTVHLLNSHAVKLLSEYLCVHP